MNHDERRRLQRVNESKKGFSRNFDKHHAVPKSRVNDVGRYDVHDDSNIFIVPAHTHRNFHSMFANLLPHEIACVLNRGWIDPRAEMVAVWLGEATDDWKQSHSGILYR